ncbi:MAG: hypothetical protein EPN14_10045 [Gallionella sp.]|nr:MAG: hypothetical protein EPN14_10045 [Gallionella sp.]
MNILAALAGALPRCRSLAGNGHAARPASCSASRQHTHNCPSYYFSAPKVTLLLFAALVSGCASSQPQRLWDASAMASLPYPTVLLKDKPDGKITAGVNTADIRQMIRIKERVENAAGSLRAELLLAEGSEPNGFSFVSQRGPAIAVNIGMVNLIGQDGDAMAALMGHELAHLHLNHGRLRQSREESRMAASVTLSFALGMFGIPFPPEVADVATTPVANKFSREEEREADRLGVEYMVRAGFDPSGSVRLQEKLGAVSSGHLLPFLSSHPSSYERVENMKRLAMERVPPPPGKEAGNIGH